MSVCVINVVKLWFWKCNKVWTDWWGYQRIFTWHSFLKITLTQDFFVFSAILSYPATVRGNRTGEGV